jgi:alkyl sulfatase BDS1-like metallo-beta-lactamase superfamily hydrolase
MTALDFEDTADFINADRCFIAALEPGVVKDAAGRVVWDSGAFDYLKADCPPTANPSLWRQAQLLARQGLYQVTERIYQVRGLDLSNMTLVEGDTGVIVIDPLVSMETAAAALALYREHRGQRPVTGLIYTHSHVDHFGGARGVLPQESRSGAPVIAPAGFMDNAVSENIYAGNAMTRRAIYMYGNQVRPAPDGQISAGLGMTPSTGTVSLIPPTVDITRTGQEETVDGVRIVFQLTPGTEAPAEMHFLFPQLRALCLAENVTHTMHNIQTLRGAVVRDARMWSRYIDEAIELFHGQYDVAFASHHWPTWGHDEAVHLLETQRDLYGYLHDQTLRMLNEGLIAAEIAEQMQLPPVLERAWSVRGYYGSLSHNVKAIYHRYLGWFEGNPARLWELPPVELATRYVDVAGGPAQALAKARTYEATGTTEDLRFAATLLNHLVFADPDNTDAKDTLARVYERLGHGSENGTWRNFYLTAAIELRRGPGGDVADITGSDVTLALTAEQLLDSLAIRIDGPRAWDENLTIDLDLTDERTRHRITLHNGVLTHRPLASGAAPRTPAGLTLKLTRPSLLGLLAGHEGPVEHNGDLGLLQRLTALVTSPDLRFPIVTP